ncbi:MAG TPA: imelysin family protein [bacterium]|nr:imelysin family protein [bacterium]
MKRLILSLSSCLLLAGAGALAWSHFGCSKAEPAVDRNAIFASLVSDVILPEHADLAQKTQDLSDATAALCADLSDTSLETARSRWKDAQFSLKKIQVLAFGPYVDGGFGVRLDFWPTRGDSIETVIAENDDFSDDFVDTLGVAVVGLPALEYLLFQDSILDAKRCSYAAAVARDAAQNAAALREAWAPEGGNFGAQLIQAGQGSAVFATSQDLLNVLVNQMLTVVELLKDADLGKPLGKKSGGVLMPDLRQSPFSEFSIQDMLANMEGVRELYLGSAAGQGVRDIAAAQDAFIADRMTTYMDDAAAAILGIPETFPDSLVGNTPVVENAFSKIAFLRSNLAGNLSGLLGVTPFFNGNDGD